MAITAQAVKELRERTGAGMMDCKKALSETDGDMDEAIKFLRTKGLAAAAKKAHRTASDGVVAVVGDERAMVILELNCETDFVARNPEFTAFADALAQQALAAGGADVAALKAQPFTGDPAHTVEEAISQKVATIGENIVLSRLERVAAGAGNRLNSYIHGGGKIGVVVEGNAAVSPEALHDVALHVAAAEPRFVNRAEVTKDVLDAEHEIALKQAMEQGKPEEIAKRIVAGKMEKFFVQEVLLEQPFAKDPEVSVGQYLKKSGGDTATVLRFVRYRLGEGSDE
ncbi:MAG: translation elongation factor Ts [Thermoanaerobaculales bacterium]|jgi:elongation factor Ts|nr:translation elongation factor Ts [Thermoanaerobaculales bacterium]